MFVCRKSWTAVVAVLALIATSTFTRAWADVNLVLQPVPEECAVRVLELDLYAVSDDDSDQSLCAMDVVLAWDPETLALLGLDDTLDYPYEWMESGFPYVSGGLNDDWTDGDALYRAFGQLLGDPAWATPDGLWVTRLRFEKLRVGLPTVIAILESAAGIPTAVYDGIEPGLDVTGSLGSASPVPLPTGDMNADGILDFSDIDPFVVAITNRDWYETQYPEGDWWNADCNCDGIVDYFDIDGFVALVVWSAAR